MKNYISRLMLILAVMSIIGSCYELYAIRTSWTNYFLFLGFAFCFMGLAFLSEHVANLEHQLARLVNVLSEAIHKGKEKNASIPKITLGITASWSEEAKLDAMSMDELERERAKAEKEQRFEWAQKVHRKIEQRKGRH